MKFYFVIIFNILYFYKKEGKLNVIFYFNKLHFSEDNNSN